MPADLLVDLGRRSDLDACPDEGLKLGADARALVEEVAEASDDCDLEVIDGQEDTRAELEAAFTGKKEMQQALNDAADRSNQILRRFEQTFKNRQLP